MGSGFKDFAAGDVLTAADVDNYLMRQTVMTFADASARDSALSGVLDEGMVAYLEDTNRFTYYDGSTWTDVVTSLSGLTLVKSQTVGSGVASQTVTNAFSSAYDNYRIIISGVVTSGGGENHDFRLGASTADYNYSVVWDRYDTGTSGSNRQAAAAAGQIGFGAGATGTTIITWDIARPFLAAQTTWSTQGFGVVYSFYGGGRHAVSTSYTDFTFSVTSPSTMTGGTIKVYGYNNG